MFTYGLVLVPFLLTYLALVVRGGNASYFTNKAQTSVYQGCLAHYILLFWWCIYKYVFTIQDTLGLLLQFLTCHMLRIDAGQFSSQVPLYSRRNLKISPKQKVRTVEETLPYLGSSIYL